MKLYSKNNHNNQKEYFLMKDVFETMPMYNTYDAYGQKISYRDAEASMEITAGSDEHHYLIQLLIENGYGEKAERIMKESEDIYILAFESESIFSEMVTKFGDQNVEALTVVGYTYWDGSNYKTAILGNEGFEEVELDDEQLKFILDELENKFYNSSSFGLTNYHSEFFKFTESQFANAFWAYEVEIIEGMEETLLIEQGISL